MNRTLTNGKFTWGVCILSSIILSTHGRPGWGLIFACIAMFIGFLTID